MKIRIGIRREDKNLWEKRTPIIPAHAGELINRHSIEVFLQSSSIRVFKDEDYAREGAQIKEDLSECPVIFALKEIPLNVFQNEKTYLFFSHTIKGQKYNMPMLKKMMELRCSLIEYEKITDEKGQRLIFFGPQAGQAGMIETLSALGKKLDLEGIENPFMTVKQAYEYGSLVEAKEEIRKLGWEIHKQGIDRSLVPFICGFAGYGRCSQGAQEIYDLLPVEVIKPEELESFVASGNFSSNRVYKVVFKEEHMVKPVSSSAKFNLKDYYQKPGKYRSVFDRYLPSLIMLFNCIYWTDEYPRFVSKNSIKDLFQKEASPRLRIIGDISCDIGGSIEFTEKATTPSDPVFVYDPMADRIIDGIEGRGVAVMAIDNLPAEIPLESSVFFSTAIKPYIPEIALADYRTSFKNCRLPDPIKKAVVLYKGELTPDYEYMKKFI